MKRNWILVVGMTMVLVMLAIPFIWLFRGGEEASHPFEAVPVTPDVPSISYSDLEATHPVETPRPSDIPEDVEIIDWKSIYEGDPMGRSVDFDGLQDRNPAVRFWLYVPGTEIDYAVLQESTVGEYYYLRRDIDGRYSRSGWLFTPKEPEGYDARDMHLLVFGHNMGGGSKVMFGTLDRYKDKSFCEGQPYLYLYWPNRTERWKVWSAFNTEKTDKIYSIPFESGTDDYVDLLEHIGSKALYDTGVAVPGSDRRIVTLSTCDRSYGGQTGRFTVNAVLDAVTYLEG